MVLLTLASICGGLIFIGFAAGRLYEWRRIHKHR